MPIDMSTLTVGAAYSRDELARRWGYRSGTAITKGVCGSRPDARLVLFVTLNKSSNQPQYDDRLEGSRLFWEGESAHGHDARIAATRESGEELHLFLRENPGEDFTYLGTLELESVVFKADAPSRFVFRLLDA